MVELVARSPFPARLPLAIGSTKLDALDLGCLTILAPFAGRQAGLSEALRAAHDLSLPAPNRMLGRAGCRAIWFARGQVLLAGPRPNPDLAHHAALIDQSDAWAVVSLHGTATEDVLARLVPVDLRASIFKRGHTVRAPLNHMAASISRIGAMRFQIMVFRSMAETLVHELQTAMEAVSARG